MENKFLQSYQDKLHNFRNLEGQPVKETAEVLRKVEESLRDLPEFIGLSVYGSRTKGYGKAESDYDFLVLYDEPKNGSQEAELFKKIRERLKDLAHNKTSHVDYAAVNLKKFQSSLESSGGRVRSWYVMEICRLLFQLAFGPKVDLYRKKIVDLINALEPKDRQEFIEEIIYDISVIESHSGYKIRKRTGINDQQASIASGRRRALWRGRIHKIFEHYAER